MILKYVIGAVVERAVDQIIVAFLMEGGTKAEWKAEQSRTSSAIYQSDYKTIA